MNKDKHKWHLSVCICGFFMKIYTTILQAYTGASDAEAIEALIMDRRWQLVVDCLDCEQAPFSQATLVRFRNALIIQGLDRRLIEAIAPEFIYGDSLFIFDFLLVNVFIIQH